MDAAGAKYDWEMAIGSYLAALEAVRDYAFRACPPLTDDFTQMLVQLSTKINVHSTAEELRASREVLTETLRKFGEEAGRDYEARTKEIREVVRLVALGSETLVARARRGNDEISSVAKAVEEVATLQDLSEMRRRLTIQVGEMREAVRRLAQEDAETIQRLTSETESLRERLQRAEQSACLDDLTGLLNRRGLERQLDVRIRRQSRFCILMFDIRNLQSIHESHGHLAADTVLREFASRLRNSIRDTDVACRWGGDEFLSVLDCPLHDVLPRSRQIYERVSGKYVISVDSREVRLQLVASMGVAEHRAGEAKEQLLSRADALLYSAR